MFSKSASHIIHHVSAEGRCCKVCEHHIWYYNWYKGVEYLIMSNVLKVYLLKYVMHFLTKSVSQTFSATRWDTVFGLLYTDLIRECNIWYVCEVKWLVPFNNLSSIEGTKLLKQDRNKYISRKLSHFSFLTHVAFGGYTSHIHHLSLHVSFSPHNPQ